MFRLVSSPLWDSKIARLELWLSKETSPSGERYPLFCKASKEIRLEVYRRSEMKQSTILARKLNPCQKWILGAVLQYLRTPITHDH